MRKNNLRKEQAAQGHRWIRRHNCYLEKIKDRELSDGERRELEGQGWRITEGDTMQTE